MSGRSTPRSRRLAKAPLDRAALARLLVELHASAVTGTLTLRHGERRADVTLRAGLVVRVQGSEPGPYLGPLLYELGALGPAALDETLAEVARTRRLHGEVLLERGAITRARLDEGLREQTLRRLQDLFTFPPDTEVVLDDAPPPAARDDDRPAVPPWPAILRSLRERPPVERALSSLDGVVKLRPGVALEAFGFSEEEREVVEALEGPARTVAQILSSSPLGPERTRALLVLLDLARALSTFSVAPVGPAALGAKGVREKASEIAAQAAHVVLGVAKDASDEAVRAAYLRLARVWHPDRLPPSLSAQAADCERVFRAVTAAYQQMSERRVLQATGSRSSTCPPDDEPVVPPLREVDAALARGDLACASALAGALRAAGKEGPAARAVILWCDAAAGAAPEDAVARAIVALDSLLAGDPECARALYYRGMLHKRLGRPDRAARDFRKVVRLEPRHVEAARELRLHEMRSRGGAAEPPPPSSRRESTKVLSQQPASGLHRLFAKLAGR